ncbi:type II toxin-antitoxin system Phd/YefM family antitoxin [Elstera cyanobacteriorum]|uniref:type II toxin-antitoxin system Phd/YefM family antitoxin n=1 Tax=Elstera cyanobacteriorum TaxID=2022747 RepID=UPI0023532970|nr:type II toxin-antitoxin system prevent-host-death family antitoxin [Elstera cyanobacteriorum]MCK6441234.1 type II toxin-antitoxin system prevent-host-death family antitoxin [Elstera cyanobacteriorum]
MGAIMRVVSSAEAQRHLDQLIEDVAQDSDYTIITRPDAPHAVLMSLDVFNGLMETAHLLRTPANAAHLEASLAEFRAAETVQRPLNERDD